MNEKTAKKTLGKKVSTFISQHKNAIVATIIYGTIGIALLWFFCGRQIIAFFSPTPLHKCEASLPTYATSIYCKEDGTQGNKKQDECLAKGPNYEYDDTLFVCRTKENTNKHSTNNQTTTQGRYTCIDVTSYDNNYDNDMLCTSPSGKQIYTNYNHAKILMEGDLSEQYEGWENYDSYDYEMWQK